MKSWNESQQADENVKQCETNEVFLDKLVDLSMDIGTYFRYNFFRN